MGRIVLSAFPAHKLAKKKGKKKTWKQGDPPGISCFVRGTILGAFKSQGRWLFRASYPEIDDPETDLSLPEMLADLLPQPTSVHLMVAASGRNY